MDENSSIFFDWMAQPGLVKKLQLALCLSLIFNILLTVQLLEVHKKKTPKVTLEQKTSTTKQVKETTKTSPEQIKDFTYKYLENFFLTSDESITYIQEHTDMNLFAKTIAVELENRQKQKLNSKFNIQDLYMEELSENEHKVIVLGQEVFANDNYRARNLTIELVVDTEKLIVKAIPLFKVKE